MEANSARWWLPLLIPAAVLAIGLVSSVHGGTRVVHQGPGDAIGSAVAGVLVIGWPFFAAGVRRQRSRSTESEPAQVPELETGSARDADRSPSAPVRALGEQGWRQENGRWYCEAHNARYCKICSS